MEEKFAGFDDEMLIGVLKKRAYYDPEAANAAIKEAIKRGIIHTEDDLLAPQYRDEPLRRSIFPAATLPQAKEKLIRSLSRIIMIAGLLPIIYGILKIAENHFTEAAVFIVFGLIWVGSAFLQMKEQKPAFFYTILVLTVIAFIYMVWFFIQVPVIRFMDLFVAVIIFGAVFYNLFYIKFLAKGK